MDNKETRSNPKKSQYFKWGLTAFIVIMASLLSVYIIYNSSRFSENISNFFGMIMPIIDGLIVAYLLIPLVDKQEEKIYKPFLKKHNIELTNKRKTLMRGLSVFIALIIVFLLIYLFFKSVVPQLIDSIQNIITQMPTYMDTLIITANKILSSLNLFEENDIVAVVENYYEDIMNFVYENILPILNGWIKSLSSSVFNFLGAIWDLFIGFFIAVYLLFSKEKFRGQSKKLIYSLFERNKANRIISDIRYIDKTFLAFIVGKIVDSIIIGCLCFIIMTICNIPYALLVSVIVGVTNVIPFFGPFIGGIPSALLIFLVNPIQALYFAIIIILLQQFDGNILGPMILGNSTGLSGFWVICSITLFGGIWGVPGMFLGVPTFACIYAGIRRIMRTSLIKKDYPYDTENYIDLKYITDDNEFIQFEYDKDTNDHDEIIEEMIDGINPGKHYIQLTSAGEDPVSEIKRSKIKDMFKRMIKFFKNLFKKKK